LPRGLVCIAHAPRRRTSICAKQQIESPSFRTALNDPAIAGNGLAALVLADQWFGISGGNLKLEKQSQEWQAVTLHKFGIDGNTIRPCEQHLQMLNAERPVGHVYSNNALGARFLACITFLDTLLADAIEEISVPTIVFPPGTPGNDSSGQPLAGQYDVNRLVYMYEQNFQAQIDTGKIRPTAAAKQATPHSSNRVDGLSLNASELVDSSQIVMTLYDCDEVDAEGYEVYEVYEVEFTGPEAGGDDKICWNCLGAGHTQRDRSKPAGQDWSCPSPRKRRDPKHHMAALAKLATARGAGSKPTFKAGRRGTTPGGPGPRVRFATRPNAQEAEVVLADEESDEEPKPALSSVEIKPIKTIADKPADIKTEFDALSMWPRTSSALSMPMIISTTISRRLSASASAWPRSSPSLLYLPRSARRSQHFSLSSQPTLRWPPRSSAR
jgi:hypothetical protein